jgi:hypothetical protein
LRTPSGGPDIYDPPDIDELIRTAPVPIKVRLA